MREAGLFIPLFPVILANRVPQGTASFRGQPPSHRFLCLWFFLSLFPVTPPSPHVSGPVWGGRVSKPTNVPVPRHSTFP